MMGMRLPFFLLLIALLAGGAAAAHAYNVTLPAGAPSNFSAGYNSTLSYIETVNRSAYLVFYPNLTGAYTQLYLAKTNYTHNVSLAYSHLADARSDAASELGRIYAYRPDALAVMMALSAFTAAALYVVMRRTNVGAGYRKRAR